MNKKYVILWLMQVGTCISLKCDYKEEFQYHLHKPRKFIEAICYNLTSVASLDSELRTTRIEKLTIGAHSTVDTLPANSAISGCSHLRILTMSFLGIGKIAPGAFSGLNVLEELDLSHNKLGEIPVGVFNDLINLVRLDLSENQITKISNGLFANLRNLRQLDLSVNLISDIDKGGLSDLVNLKELDLEQNNITVLHENLFKNMTKFEKLSISKNPLTVLQNVGIVSNFSKLFAGYTLLKNFDVNLRNSQLVWVLLPGGRLEEFDFALLNSGVHYLDLSNNRLRTLKNISFVNAETIDLSNNEITELDEISSNIITLSLSHNNIKNLKSAPESSDKGRLRNLDLSFNQIESASCFGFTHLGGLSLENNQVTIIKENGFADCPNLENINLSSNKIKSFENNAFKNLNKLKFLYVSSNNLEELNSGSFSGLVNLETLFFDNNRIVSIDIKGIVKNTPKLHSITMEHNWFICEHLYTTLKSLRLHHVVPIDVNHVNYDECKEPQAS